MAIARTYAATLIGVGGHPVEVEADLSAGLPGLTFTGLPDTTVVEARERVRAAVLNAGVQWPNRRITVALLPADLRKNGSRFDLALAVAILAAAGTLPTAPLAGIGWIGELGLDGRVRAVRGVLPAVMALARAGITRVVVAGANGAEAALVPEMEVRAVDQLRDVIAWLRGEQPAPELVTADLTAAPVAGGVDLSDVVGQPTARRAIEVCAAGGHHLFMSGSPGAGKTMLAERLPGILPELADDQALEVTAVHSVAGALPDGAPLIRRPPFQAPHHTASMAALVGGGPGLARAGAISLAHPRVAKCSWIDRWRFVPGRPGLCHVQSFGTATVLNRRQPRGAGCLALFQSPDSLLVLTPLRRLRRSHVRLHRPHSRPCSATSARS